MNCENCKNYEPKVKEETLDSILHELLYNYIGSSGCLAVENRIKKHISKGFDESTDGYCVECGVSQPLAKLRKALKNL